MLQTSTKASQNVAPQDLEYRAKNLEYPAMRVQVLSKKPHFPDRKGRVFVHRQIGQQPMAQHRHEFFEIAIVLSGSGVHVTGRRHQRMAAGDVFVLNTRRAHGFKDTQALNLVNILIRRDVLPRVGRDLQGLPGFHALFSGAASGAFGAHVRLSGADLGQVEDWVNRLEEETHRRAQGGYLLAEAYLALIIGVLCRRHGGTAFEAPVGRVALGRVLSWLEKNLGEPIRVADLAAQAGMSLRTFHRAFRATMDATPAAYLERIRMRRAADLLRVRHPRLRVGEVAAACGYDDGNYFSRVFRRTHGRSPRAFQAASV